MHNNVNYGHHTLPVDYWLLMTKIILRRNNIPAIRLNCASSLLYCISDTLLHSLPTASGCGLLPDSLCEQCVCKLWSISLIHPLKYIMLGTIYSSNITPPELRPHKWCLCIRVHMYMGNIHYYISITRLNYLHVLKYFRQSRQQVTNFRVKIITFTFLHQTKMF